MQTLAKISTFGAAAFFLALPAGATTIAVAGYGIDYSYRIGDDTGFAELGGQSSLPLLTDSAAVLDFDDAPDGTGTVNLRADLATGEMGVSTELDNPARANEIFANLSMTDTLTIDLTGLSGLQVFSFSSTLDGSLGFGTDEDDFLETSVVEYGFSLTGESGGFSFAPLRVAVEYGIDDSGLSGDGIFDLTASQVTQNDITGSKGTFSSYGPDSFVGTFELNGGQVWELEYYSFLNIDQRADFLGTSTFDLSGPVPITSASGTFLSASMTPIPVPAALPLMLAGIGALALARRSKRR